MQVPQPPQPLTVQLVRSVLQATEPGCETKQAAQAGHEVAPGAGWRVFGGQSSQRNWPERACDWPAGQRAHSVAAAAAAWDPGAHSSHTLDPSAVPYLPLGQWKQAVWPLRANVPSAQASQAEDPAAAAYVPAGHSVHCSSHWLLAPAALNSPAGHGWQEPSEARPQEALDAPAAHGRQAWHLVCAASGWYLPAGHAAVVYPSRKKPGPTMG